MFYEKEGATSVNSLNTNIKFDDNKVTSIASVLQSDYYRPDFSIAQNFITISSMAGQLTFFWGKNDMSVILVVCKSRIIKQIDKTVLALLQWMQTHFHIFHFFKFPLLMPPLPPGECEVSKQNTRTPRNTSKNSARSGRRLGRELRIYLESTETSADNFVARLRSSGIKKTLKESESS